MGKKGKKDPNAPTLIPEDTFIRVSKLKDQKVAMKQPKGDLTAEEWCIPPAFHSQPEFKQIIRYWQQCAVVHYTERDMKVPSRMKYIEDDNLTPKKPHPRKEIQDLFKFVKTLTKQATKRTGQFLKQLEKKEAKELKRTTLLKQIKEVDDQMNEELRSSRRFTEKQELFNKKYMVGSKLGEKVPRKNALIMMELSDRQNAWIDEAREEVSKLLQQVIAVDDDNESLNLMTFSVSNQTMWCPQFQQKTDPKKGLADAGKWLNKNCSSKLAASQAFPPDWLGALQKATADASQMPWRILLCCSKSPAGNSAEVLQFVNNLRATRNPPAKNEPVLPINVVAFDPSIVGNAEEKEFFDELAGPHGSFMIDTSAEDLVALDKMLKAVAVKKKQLDKLNAKLRKMEDLSDRVIEDRSLLQAQVALQRMLESDLELCDWALKNETPVVGPEI